MRNKISITVIIPVKNEEKNIGRCLRALENVAEIIVVDSNSTDRTPQIVAEYGARLINFEWNGGFPKKRNWVLMHEKFKHDWVLFLDADEIVNDSFMEALEAAIAVPEYQGYWLNYDNYFLGKKLRYGDPQKKLALFKIGAGLYERIDEDSWSSLDMEVHEHPQIKGKVGEITKPIDHNDDQGIVKYVIRHKDYALWEAKRMRALQAIDNTGNLTSRQKFKYKNLEKWWFSWFYFLYTYFYKLGFIDGSAGLYYAIHKRWYFQLILLILREDRQEGTDSRASK